MLVTDDQLTKLRSLLEEQGVFLGAKELQESAEKLLALVREVFFVDSSDLVKDEYEDEQYARRQEIQS